MAANDLNVPTPPVDIYVAASTAKDETDPTAVLLGSVASIPAASMNCADPRDTGNEPAANGVPVCSMPLTDAGRAALGSFVKNYKNAPFQVIVKATITATGGTPIPAAPSKGLDVFVRPTLTLSVLK